jgi:thioesterase domain-containing protein/acyl carrier protein
MAPPLMEPGMVEPAPISFAQEDLWHASRLSPRAAPYNEVAVLRRSGPLDVGALRRAFDEVVRRHDAWRTTFPLVGERPVQLVGPPRSIAFPVIDLRHSSCRDTERHVARVAGELAGRSYDLEHGPTLRPLVVRVADEDHRIYLAAHHLVFDCLSLVRVAVPELIGFYEAALAGRSLDSAPAAAQYRDYTAWERKWVDGPSGRQRLDHWRRHLAGAVPLGLPLDRPRGEHPRFRGAAEPIRLPAPLAERIRVAGRAATVSTFQMLAAGFAVLLQRYTGQTEVVFGTAADLRRRRELEPVLGFAATWLAIRADLTGDPTFATVVRRLRDEVLDAVDMAIPFGQVMAAMQLQDGSGVNPMLRVLFVLHPRVELPSGWDLDMADPLVADEIGAAKLDLQVELQERLTGEIEGRVIFDADLFDRDTVRDLIMTWPDLLETLVDYPERPLSVRSTNDATRLVTGASPNGSERTGANGRGREVTPPLSELERALVGIWGRILGIDEIDEVGVHDDFFDLGGSSLRAVQMLLEVEQQLGVTVSVTAMLDAGATVAGLADVVEFGEPESDPGAGPALVFVWPHEPAVVALRHLRAGFGAANPITSLVVPDSAPTPPGLTVLAEQLLAEVRAAQATGPYLLGGFSLGGLIAYEIAARLRASGETVAWLAMLDVPTPHVWKRAQRRSARFALLLDEPPARRRTRLAGAAQRLAPTRSAAAARTAAAAPAVTDMVDWKRRWGPTLVGYTPEGHDVPMDLFVTHGSSWRYREPTLGWAGVHTGPLSIHLVPGDHHNVLTPPYIETVGQRLAERLGSPAR